MRLPDGDTHFIPYEVTGHYQVRVLRKALPYIRNHGLALDIGGHVGFWSRQLAIVFDRVVSFEPELNNFLCLVRNAPVNVLPMNWAVGDRFGYCSMKNEHPENSGAFVLKDGDDVRLAPLDAFGWAGVGLVKIDVQGMEANVLRGGMALLKRERPVVVVETTVEESENDVSLLEEMGAKLRHRIGKDSVFSWDA